MIRLPKYMRVLAMGVCGLSACSDVSEITAEDEARRLEQSAVVTTSAAGRAVPVYQPRSSALNQQRPNSGCSSGRSCTKSRPRPTVTTGPDASGYFETGRAQAANRQAQGRNASQQILLNNGKPETYPGQRTTLEGDRTRLQQQELRQQRDRLQNAPFGHTVGSIYAQ